MARDDWMRGERLRTDWRGREERREDYGRREPARDETFTGREPGERRTFERQDYGQADYSLDYAYDPRRRAGYRNEPGPDFRDDYGQADYSSDYGYDPQNRSGYRRFAGGEPDYGRRMDEGDYRRERLRDPEEADDARPSWRERAGALFGGRSAAEEPRRDDERRREEARRSERRRGPSDRVLWAVIVERLEDQRGLDLRDVEVVVDDGEVTLNGTVRRKSDKRRIEDIADLDGVRNVQNNLRVRERGWF